MPALTPAHLQHLISFLSGQDLADPSALQAALTERFPVSGPDVQAIAARMRAGVESGALCDRGKMPVKWSRVFRASEESGGWSADAVLMNGTGPRHRHPAGEIDLCLAEGGDPWFDGHPEGWVVYGPDSEHVPTVSGGTMLILYLLPGGAIEFQR